MICAFIQQSTCTSIATGTGINLILLLKLLARGLLARFIQQSNMYLDC